MGIWHWTLLAFRCGQVLVSLWRQFVFHAIRGSHGGSAPWIQVSVRSEEYFRFRPEPLLEHQDSTNLTVQKGKKERNREKIKSTYKQKRNR